MSWISTASGRRIDYLDPDPAQIDIEDIAAGLAALPRWLGQTLHHGLPTPYSVAQHSCHCCEELREIQIRRRIYVPLALAGLLHDAAEAYMGDCPRPLKRQLGAAWDEIEARLAATIFKRFGLDAEWLRHPAIKHVDDRMLMTERRDLQPRCPPWDGGPWPEPFDAPIEPWSAAFARRRFLMLFHGLNGDVFSPEPAA